MFNTVKPLETPREIKHLTPVPASIAELKSRRDAEIAAVLKGEDRRMLMIIGPCSADNPKAVVEYIGRLGKLQIEVRDKVIIIPRIYTGKPRTKGEGYKGIFHQPDPAKAPDLAAGILLTRKMNLDAIEASGLTCADEMLYPDNYAYMDDLLSYVTIGARSSENQQHRLVGSGVTTALGVKNPMHGSMQVLINSIYSTQIPNEFQYNSEQVRTSGNPLSHAVLRGFVDDNGLNNPNYHYEDVVKFSAMYEKAGLANPSIVIDTNHSNSNKDPLQQLRIVHEVMTNRAYSGDFGRYIKGFMVESYLEDGRQEVSGHVYGKSITDACIGWEKTARLLYEVAEKV